MLIHYDEVKNIGITVILFKHHPGQGLSSALQKQKSISQLIVSAKLTAHRSVVF